MDEIITPIVHMNGDRKSTLIGNLETAYRAVGKAMDMLRNCAPNGRNYYPETGRMDKALAQHAERQTHLLAVLRSLEAEALQIDRENPERR